MSEFREILRRTTGATLYTVGMGSAKQATQAALLGRTPYATDETLKYFHCKILACGVAGEGSLWWIVTSDALDQQYSKRGFRYVVFDLFGKVVARPDIESAYPTQSAARKALGAWFEDFDVQAYYRAALAERADRLEREMEELRAGAVELEGALDG